MVDLHAILYLSRAMKYVIHQEQVNLFFAPCAHAKNHRLYTDPTKHLISRNVKMHNKRYNQNMNRRKHQIKQPGVDVQRKNIYRKGRN